MNCDHCGAPWDPLHDRAGASRCRYCGTPKRAAAAAAAQFAEAKALAEVPLDIGRVPPAPRRPSANAREIVFRYQGAQGVRLTIGLVFLGMGLVMSAVFALQLPADFALAASAATAQGVVTGVESTSTKVNGARVKEVHFRFQVGRESFESESSMLGSTPATGAKVGVEYLPAWPEIARIEGTTRSTIGYAGVFTYLFPLIGFVLALRAYLDNRREIRAFVRGTPVLARVTYSGSDTSVSVNKRHPFKLEWSFDAGGRERTGKISHMEASKLRALVRCGQVLVVYDPADPKTNTVFVS